MTNSDNGREERIITRLNAILVLMALGFFLDAASKFVGWWK